MSLCIYIDIPGMRLNLAFDGSMGILYEEILPDIMRD